MRGRGIGKLNSLPVEDARPRPSGHPDCGSLFSWQQPRLGSGTSRVLSHSFGWLSGCGTNDHVGCVAFNGITRRYVSVFSRLANSELGDSRVGKPRLQRLKVCFGGNPGGNLIIVAQECPRLWSFGAFVSATDLRVRDGSPQNRIVTDRRVILSRGHGKRRSWRYRAPTIQSRSFKPAVSVSCRKVPSSMLSSRSRSGPNTFRNSTAPSG